MQRAIFVDDDKGAHVFAKLLNKSDPNGLDVEFMQPNRPLTEIAAQILTSNIQLLLLDYRLDQNRTENASANLYKAGPLAQHLRDHAIDAPQEDFPIVLLSFEENIKKLFEPDATAHDLFDASFTKQRAQESAASVCSELLSLIDAYIQTKAMLKANERAVSLLKLPPSEAGVIAHRVLENMNQLTAPHLIVTQVRKHLVARNGLLLSDAAVTARLGIASGSPDTDELFAGLANFGIGYDGILSSASRRWWAHRLLSQVRRITDQSFFSWGADRRVEALNKALTLALQPAVSRWTKKSDALVTFICSSCRQATELAASVAAFDPYPYQFNDRKRICYMCLATGEYEERNLLVDEKDEFVRDQIASGQLKPPA